MLYGLRELDLQHFISRYPYRCDTFVDLLGDLAWLPAWIA